MLSKSDYLKYRDCSCLLWLVKTRPDLLPPDDEDKERMFAQGRIVDEYVHTLYPGGVKVEGYVQTGFANTKKAMSANPAILFQPTAIAGELNARADILVRNGDGWDIHEVKSSNSVKDEHIPDLAFQRICFERAGFPIRKTVLVHLNRSYVRKGDVDPKKLFVSEDVTSDVNAMLKDVEQDIPNALAVMKWGKGPGSTQLLACSNQATCKHISYWLASLKPKQLEELLKELPPKTVAKMLEKEIISSPQVTEKFMRSIKWRRPEELWPKKIEPEAITDVISRLEYPLHFLDYETYREAIPPFDGTSPWQQVPFQFCVIVIPKPGAKAVRYDFLKATFENPIPELVAHLREAIGDKGSVLVWFESFEKSRNAEMARRLPEHAKFLLGINKRVYDLMLIFKNKLYRLPEFKGKSSLKIVLPTLVPKLAYEDLEIQEGNTASASWPVVTDMKSPAASRKKLYQDMIDYCHRDVDGMVKILEHLRKVSKE